MPELPVSCGPPALNTRITIHHSENGEAMSDGEVGEIHVHSPSVALGYWNNPTATAAAFPRPGTLRTGDLGFLRDGELYVTGRVKDLIIIRGRNLYPHDIENCVAALLPTATGANSIAAFEFSGNDSGSGALGVLIEAPRAWVSSVRKQDGEITSHIRRIREAVAETFEITADLIAFVAPGDFPRTSSGKVQRGAARDLATAAHDERILFAVGAAVPATLKREVAAICEKIPTNPRGHKSKHSESAAALLPLVCDTLLAVLREQVDGSLTRLDPDLPVTAYGMDSLAAADAVIRLEKAIGRTTPRDLFDATQTARTVARILADKSANDHVSSTGATVAPHQSLALPQRMTDAMERVRLLRTANLYPFHTVTSVVEPGYATLDGERMIMFAGYEYLDVGSHPDVKTAMVEAVARFGTGAHGSPIIGGKTIYHHRLEQKLAALMNSDDALVYTSGFLASYSTVTAFVGPGDVVIGDSLNHASIVDGCRSSGARFVSFAHSELAALERALVDNPSPHTLVVVDGVFSMDGDIANIPEISRLCRKHGAYLMVDEAHAIGAVGGTGRGVQEYFGLPSDAIDLKMGTLSKALGGVGGFVAGKAEVIDFLRHHARGYMFAAALPAPNAAVSLAGLTVLENEPWRVRLLQEKANRWRDGVKALGFDTFASKTPVVPVRMPDQSIAFEFAHRCRRNGVVVVPVVYPAVAQNAPRVRTFVTLGLSNEAIDHALEVFAVVGREVGLIG